MKVKFGSVCSGIEAASVAWSPLGFSASWLSEIEKFPAELLAYRYPGVQNIGDMLKAPSMVRSGEILAPDILVGGTPCQSFSVAGMRQGLSDERGQLTMSFVDLANEIDKQRVKNGEQESIIVWENVPGVLSSKDNAFGCFLGALAGESCELKPSGKRWPNAGFVLGPQRAIAWRVLDAQYFGVAQRRRRVFVVASARDGFDPAKVLFEFDGVRRDTPPSREAGKETAGDVGAGVKSAGSHGELAGALCARDYKGVGTQYVTEGKLVLNKRPAEVACTLNAAFGGKLGLDNQHIDGGASLFVPALSYGVPGNWIGRKPENGGNSTQFMYEIAPTQTATDKHGVIAINNCLNPEQPQCWRVYDPHGVAPALQSGEARGNIIAFNNHQAQVIAIQGGMIGRKPENGPQGTGYDESGVCFTQTATDRHAVAYRQITAAFKAGQGASAGSIGYKEEVSPTLTSADSGSNRTPALLQATVNRTETVVRRLTPIECERLQGFPDNYTQIPWRGKPAEECPDGHRYKALGNSMAVPVMRWIGKRILKELKSEL